MDLINMQNPKPKEEEGEVAQAPTGTAKPMIDTYYEKYPYGLRITLNDKEVAQLEIDLKDYPAGGKGLGKFNFIVVDHSESESQQSDGSVEKRRRLELQITDLCLCSSENFEQAFSEAVGD